MDPWQAGSSATPIQMERMAPPDPSPNDTATVVCAAAEEIASLIHSEVICS